MKSKVYGKMLSFNGNITLRINVCMTHTPLTPFCCELAELPLVWHLYNFVWLASNYTKTYCFKRILLIMDLLMARLILNATKKSILQIFYEGFCMILIYKGTGVDTFG